MEGDNPPVLADVPATGHAGFRFQRIGIFTARPSNRALMIKCSGIPVATWGFRDWGSEPLPKWRIPARLPLATFDSPPPQDASRAAAATSIRQRKIRVCIACEAVAGDRGANCNASAVLCHKQEGDGRASLPRCGAAIASGGGLAPLPTGGPI